MENNKSKNWTLLFWVGAFFCFVFFPIFLLDIGLESYINTKNQIEEQEAYRKLGINLEKLLQYGDCEHYYHALLKKIFDIAEGQKDYVKYLEKAIKHLKERNPNTFTFIFWDNANGKVIDSVTDEKGHKYILNTLFEVFNKVSAENIRNYPVDPATLDIVNKKINIIRPYIGSFFVEESLIVPLLKANLGKIVPVSGNREKHYFWFQAGKKITMMATINYESVQSFSGIYKLINGLNMNSDDGIKYGVIDLIHKRNIIPEKDESRAAELYLGLTKYDNFSNSKLYTNNYLMLVKILNPFSRAFCYIEKDRVFKYKDIKNNVLLISCCFIFLFLFGLFILYKFTNYNFSIRWKLIIFFLYANGLPLLTLSFLGYDYLQQIRNILLEKTYEQISQLINDFDSKFVLIKNEYELNFNSIVNTINSNFDNQAVVEENYQKLKAEVQKTNFSDFCVIDEEGNVIVSGKNNVNYGMLKEAGLYILKFANNKEYTPRLTFNREKYKESKSLDGMYKGGVFLDDIISKIGKISLEQMVDEVSYYYFNFIGDKNNRIYKAFVVAAWPVYRLQENYVENYLSKFSTNSYGIKLIAFSDKFGKIFPNEESLEKSLINRFRQVFNLNSLSFDKLVIDGKEYAAFGSVGRELKQIAVLGIYPLSIIDDEVANYRFRLIIFIIVNLILTLGISCLLSTYFLAPIKDLQGGIEAMGHRNFQYRIPIKSGDEFGALGNVFNNAFESLEELAIATTVQENLFPLTDLKQNKAYVWGKSVTMTSLGGDYFDYFSLSDNEIGVLMGDVAGHGVPAGFLMAMAKSSVLLADEDKYSPDKLLSAIHKVFHQVKSKKIKRMMTCIYFVINTETGEYKVSNAGHCYPAIINAKGEVSYLEIIGTPLGIMKRARYVNVEGQLEPNSFLFLYTDGMLEARNEEGESMGLGRLTELISKSYSENPKTYYENIFNGYKKWAPSADDDITMVLVKFGFDDVEDTVTDSIKTNKDIVI